MATHRYCEDVCIHFKPFVCDKGHHMKFRVPPDCRSIQHSDWGWWVAECNDRDSAFPLWKLRKAFHFS